jgi:putative DNA-invertase from lambdoid prophage Rac
MSHIAYYRVSTLDQSVDTQRSILGRSATIDKEFMDEGVSGGTLAKDRPGFRALLDYVREGDVLHIYAVDRLGRDAIDVQATIRCLLDRGIVVEVTGLGTVGKGVGELIIAVLAQIADMERKRIAERTSHGRALAMQSLLATGITHRGKASLGRPPAAEAEHVRTWKAANSASVKKTALEFGISESTVKRYCAVS